MNIKKIVNTVNNGEIIVIPTDTIYGVGVKADNKKAIRDLMKIKGRKNNIPILVSDIQSALKLFNNLPMKLKNLANKYWPGALTIVYEAKNDKYLTNSNGTIAVRVPNNKITKMILEKTGPMAVSSANKIGEKEPENMSQALFSDKISMLVKDKEIKKKNRASTIVTFEDNKIKILRQGDIKI